MSSQKIMSAEEIRMELARRRMTRAELARKIGVSNDYVHKILCERRIATRKREEITKVLGFSYYTRDDGLRGIA